MHFHNTNIIAKSLKLVQLKAAKKIIASNGGTVAAPSPAGEIMYSLPGYYTQEADTYTARQIMAALAKI